MWTSRMQGSEHSEDEGADHLSKAEWFRSEGRCTRWQLYVCSSCRSVTGKGSDVDIT